MLDYLYPPPTQPIRSHARRQTPKHALSQGRHPVHLKSLSHPCQQTVAAHQGSVPSSPPFFPPMPLVPWSPVLSTPQFRPSQPSSPLPIQTYTQSQVISLLLCLCLHTVYKCFFPLALFAIPFQIHHVLLHRSSSSCVHTHPLALYIRSSIVFREISHSVQCECFWHLRPSTPLSRFENRLSVINQREVLTPSRLQIALNYSYLFVPRPPPSIRMTRYVRSSLFSSRLSSS